MQERRKHPRIIVDLPATVRFSLHSDMQARLIELSGAGARFLCALAPEIHSELELRFSLPSRRIGHEFRLMANVRHLFDVIATTGKGADYRYVAGVEFQNIQSQDRAILEEFCAAACTQK